MGFGNTFTSIVHQWHDEDDPSLRRSQKLRARAQALQDAHLFEADSFVGPSVQDQTFLYLGSQATSAKALPGLAIESAIGRRIMCQIHRFLTGLYGTREQT